VHQVSKLSVDIVSKQYVYGQMVLTQTFTIV